MRAAAAARSAPVRLPSIFRPSAPGGTRVQFLQIDLVERDWALAWRRAPCFVALLSSAVSGRATTAILMMDTRDPSEMPTLLGDASFSMRKHMNVT